MQWLLTVALISLLAPITALAACRDYPGLGHLQGYTVDGCQERTYDSVVLESQPGEKISVEGHTISYVYTSNSQEDHASTLEVYRNFDFGLKSLKAEMLWYPADIKSDSEHMLARFYRNGGAVYVDIRVESEGWRYRIFVVEQKTFEPSIITSPN